MLSAREYDPRWGVEQIGEQWVSRGRRWRMVEGFGVYWLQMLRTYHDAGERVVCWVFWNIDEGPWESSRGVCGQRAMEHAYGLLSRNRAGWLSSFFPGHGWTAESAHELMMKYTEIPAVGELATSV